MRIASIDIEDKIEQLLLVLEKDVEHLENCLVRVDQLRSLVVKHDDAGLSALLEEIGKESDIYGSNELQRNSIRMELADDLGCDVEQLTLTRLEEILPAGQREQVSEKKNLLRSLAMKVRGEYMKTEMILSECSRINSVLLKNVFELGLGKGVVTYNSQGSSCRQGDSAFVNMRI